jgi:hypothetical protein
LPLTPAVVCASGLTEGRVFYCPSLPGARLEDPPNRRSSSNLTFQTSGRPQIIP